jgi:photosystem II stability/assembly factor-like uncharacterized protein
MNPAMTMKKITSLLLLIILSSCGGKHEKAVEKDNRDSLNLKSPVETSDGIIYFSRDNGMTWKNTSGGLPEKTSIGLGGIAVSSTSVGIVTKENGVYFFDFQRNSWMNIPTEIQIIKNNPEALILYKGEIYVGTQYGGIFFSDNQGTTWTSKNLGLGNLTIRRFTEIDNKLYAGTNGGLYSYNEELNKWEWEFGPSSLQVNGIAEFDGDIYIGTNEGAFKSEKDLKKWKKLVLNHSLHNITAFDKIIYAMTYNELFSSTDKGESWQSIQKGLPKELYTFNVIKNYDAVFAGQWDGIYRKDISSEDWKFSSNGLPNKFAAINFKSYNGILIISCSERKLRPGMATEK